MAKHGFISLTWQLLRQSPWFVWLIVVNSIAIVFTSLTLAVVCVLHLMGVYH